ncbi:MAG: hypothetical protein Rhob2KO_06730 [Rhodopirellula baltica]
MVCGWPPKQPIQSFKSSIAMNRTFGPDGVGGESAKVDGAANKIQIIEASKRRCIIANLSGREKTGVGVENRS